MKQALRYLSAGVLLVLTSSTALACYTVYNRANQMIYHAAAAPVDMRYPLHQTLPAVFPGGHLVFSITDTSCPAVNLARTGSVTRAVNALPSRTSYAPSPGEAVFHGSADPGAAQEAGFTAPAR